MRLDIFIEKDKMHQAIKEMILSQALALGRKHLLMKKNLKDERKNWGFYKTRESLRLRKDGNGLWFGISHGRMVFVVSLAISQNRERGEGIF